MSKICSITQIDPIVPLKCSCVRNDIISFHSYLRHRTEYHT